jgi:hypothetical protein
VKKSEDIGKCGTYGGEETAYWALVGKPEGKIPKRRWAGNIKIAVQERGRGGRGLGPDWSDSG